MNFGLLITNTHRLRRYYYTQQERLARAEEDQVAAAPTTHYKLESPLEKLIGSFSVIFFSFAILITSINRYLVEVIN